MVSAGMILGGRYKLDERIAGGGMGDVWRGTDEVLGRTVAVKILLPSLLEEAGFAERFRGEARTMATINHPGVVDVYDYGSDPAAGAYLVMEYVEGDALSRTLSQVGRLTPARTMALIAQAADALQAAHDKGIVHRDVKPGNLLVRPNGSLVLTDFGIARSALVGQLTAVGSVLGTASYISPEQAAGGVATPLSDVYALGVVAYQCLAGRRPFEGENPIEIAMKHVREQPAPLPPDTPPAVRAIVARAMAKDPAARFPSATALGQVARQASVSLSSGSPIPVSPATGQTSPGPVGTPISGVPTSPAAGHRPPAPVAGGTRVMPPYSPGAAGTGATAGGYNRGAASVPVAPSRRSDTGYFTPTASTPSTNQSSRRGLVIAGVVVGLAVLLVLTTLGTLALMNKHNTPPNNSPNAATSQQNGGAPPASTPSPAAQLVDLQCNALKGRDAQYVKEKLQAQGFNVVDATQTAGGKKGRVADISPCQAVRGATIAVSVYAGRGDSGESPGNTVPSLVCGIGAPVLCSPSPQESPKDTPTSSPPAAN